MCVLVYGCVHVFHYRKEGRKKKKEDTFAIRERKEAVHGMRRRFFSPGAQRSAAQNLPIAC